MTPDRADSLALLLRRVHGRYAQYLNARLRRSGHLWQNRFYSCPVEESRLGAVLRYVEMNPVRAGLAREAKEHRWSSAAAHLGGADRSGLLDQEFWNEFGGTDAWERLLASGSDPLDEERLRRCMYGGRPYGGEAFLQTMEERFGRSWRRGVGEENRARTAGWQRTGHVQHGEFASGTERFVPKSGYGSCQIRLSERRD